MKQIAGCHAPQLAPITIRPRQRADVAPLDLLRRDARTTEIAPTKTARDLATPIALEAQRRLIGEAQALRIARQSSEGPGVIFGGGSWVKADLFLPEEVLMRLITATRHDVLRQLGLREVMSLVPLECFEALQKFYCFEGYVQQVAAGALEEPLLRAHLRLGARIIALHETPLPMVQVCWKNPTR